MISRLLNSPEAWGIIIGALGFVLLLAWAGR